MTALVYYIICAVLSLLVLAGISMMSRVKTAVMGNSLSAFAILAGIIVTLVYNKILGAWTIYPLIGVGAIIGWVLSRRVKMIEMPEMVALLNGIGGAASALVGMLSLMQIGTDAAVFAKYPMFTVATGMLALSIGMLTLVGSLIAAGKLHKVLPQKPVVHANHALYTGLSLFVTVFFLVFAMINHQATGYQMFWLIAGGFIFSSLFGYFFAIRVGGADMPITISLLNSLSGVAGAIAGMAVGDILLVSVGGIVGASGLLLTQIMCRAMNRKLIKILMGGGTKKTAKPASKQASASVSNAPAAAPAKQEITAGSVLNAAKEVIIVPGYGMALAQAQHLVRQLAEKLSSNGANVRYAIHPVAGRMPGHMNVLLSEADVPYDLLFEMDAINDDFAKADAVIVIGANDVINPAAREAEDTPIYGMPVLNVDKAKNVFICNFDLKPGYAGVDNPLYSRSEGVFMKLGDAKESISALIGEMDAAKSGAAPVASSAAAPAITAGSVLNAAKEVIIVPGYGMALAQAQHLVRQLAEKLSSNGANVRYAIHPVAGRMPGHMNVLLSEADVPYDLLFEMDAINEDFAKADAVIVIGANDVINPAAREAEDTPIYGMPVLNVDKAKNVFICNFDLKPGYAGVDNPLYSRSEGVFMKLGDAKESISALIGEMDAAKSGVTPLASSAAAPAITAGSVLNAAKEVIIVPGYGMALAQAQHLVRQLAEKLSSNGANVRYAIHPVAGRMPGHMNVLLSEADVPYDLLFEMDAINEDFAKADAVIVIGANDVINPAAREAEDTPIYGMPVLNVDKAKNVFICNFDLKPGYAGVDNPLYSRSEGVFMKLGDAKESISALIGEMDTAK